MRLGVVLSPCIFCRNKTYKLLIQSQMKAEQWHVSVSVMYQVLPCLQTVICLSKIIKLICAYSVKSCMSLKRTCMISLNVATTYQEDEKELGLTDTRGLRAHCN
jgi:hypothetical protein